MFRLPVVKMKAFTLMFFVGARLARDGDLDGAIAGKPCSHGIAFS
ncbi:hypothetical protein [Pseudomonas sp. TMB3-21]